MCLAANPFELFCLTLLANINDFYSIRTFHFKFYIHAKSPACTDENQLKCEKVSFFSEKSEINSTLFKSVHWCMHWCCHFIDEMCMLFKSISAKYLMFHKRTIVSLIYSKKVFLSSNKPRFMDAGKMRKTNRNKYCGKSFLKDLLNLDGHL